MKERKKQRKKQIEQQFSTERDRQKERKTQIQTVTGLKNKHNPERTTKRNTERRTAIQRRRKKDKHISADERHKERKNVGKTEESHIIERVFRDCWKVV